MAGLKDAIGSKIDPHSWKIVEIKSTFFLLAIRMSFVDEVVGVIQLAEIPFPVLALIFVCDLLIKLQKRRKEDIGGSKLVNVGQWFGEK